jgi:hypothetical protein
MTMITIMSSTIVNPAWLFVLRMWLTVSFAGPRSKSAQIDRFGRKQRARQAFAE